MTLVGECLLHSLAQTEDVARDQCDVGEEELLKLPATQTQTQTQHSRTGSLHLATALGSMVMADVTGLVNHNHNIY